MVDLLGDDGLLDLRDDRTRRAARSDPQAFIDDARRRATTLPETNDELTAWADQRRSDAPTRPDGPTTCHRCDRSPRLACNSCGRPTCAAHSWAMLGVCRDCATEDRMTHWHKERQASDRNWLEDDP